MSAPLSQIDFCHSSLVSPFALSGFHPSRKLETLSRVGGLHVRERQEGV